MKLEHRFPALDLWRFLPNISLKMKIIFYWINIKAKTIQNLIWHNIFRIKVNILSSALFMLFYMVKFIFVVI
jgi:hypothetical protein